MNLDRYNLWRAIFIAIKNCQLDCSDWDESVQSELAEQLATVIVVADILAEK